jgi:cytochrome P450
MKSYELHTAVNRRKIFNALPKKIWRENDFLRIWVIADPQLCAEIVRSSQMEMPDLLTVVERVETTAKISLENIKIANRCLPALLSGEQHSVLRKQLATFLMGGLKRVEGTLPDFLEKNLALLRKPGIVDLYVDIARPLVAHIVSELIGQKITEEIQNLDLGDIFPLNKTPSKLRRLNADYGKALEFLSQSTDDQTELACKLSCLTFGVDSLTMMIVENILELITDQSVNELPLKFPREAGVPVTFRSPREDCHFGVHHFKKGEVLRLQIQANAYSEQTDHRDVMFGAGLHSCVGRQLSLKIWSQLAKAINAIGLRAEFIEQTLGLSHFVAHYRSVKIRVIS